MPGWIELTGATQVAQIRRTTTTGTKKSVAVTYPIIGLTRLIGSTSIAAGARHHAQRPTPPTISS